MRLWAAWVRLTTRTESGTSIALFRIGIGLCVLWTLGSVISAGALEPLWFDRAHGGIGPTQMRPLVKLLGGATPATIWTLVLASSLGGIGLIAGIGGRITALLTLLSTQALIELNPMAGGSYDVLLQNALWLLVITPSTSTLSADSKLSVGSWISDRPVGMWARYLIAFQLVLMYTSTGWQKLSSYWTPGGDFSALFYILQQPSWQRTDLSWVADVFPLTQIGTAVSWFWEVTGPVLLIAMWMNDTPSKGGRLRRMFAWAHVRDLYVGIGLIMHLALLVLLDVGPFTPISLAFYAALFAPHEWERLVSRPRGEP